MHLSAAAENTCSAPKKLLIKSLFDLESTLEFSRLLQQDFLGLFPAGDSSHSIDGRGSVWAVAVSVPEAAGPCLQGGVAQPFRSQGGILCCQPC